MGTLCKCTSGGNNLGQSPCDPILRSVNAFLFKEIINVDGTIPSIDFTPSPFNEAAWEVYTKASPLRNRYLLGVGVDDYEWEQQEAEVVESANKIERLVMDGFTQITLNIYNASFKQYEKFKALECLKLGINPIDDAGQVAGVDLGDKKLGLIPIDSFRVRKQATQNSGVASHLVITFRIPHTFNLGSIRLWQPASEDFSPLQLLPIADVEVTDLAATNASAIVTFKVGFDSSRFGFDPFVGLAKENVTITVDGVAATIDELTETADGEYAAELSSPVATGEVVSATAITARGFELKKVVSLTV